MNKYAILLSTFFLFSCNDKSADEYLTEAKLSLKNNALDTATIELKNALKAEPSLAEARFLLGKIYFDGHQYLSAEKELERAFAFKYNANSVLPLLVKAYYYTETDTSLVDLNLDKVNLTDDNKTQVKFYQALGNIRLGNEDKAKLLLNNIRALNNNSIYGQLALVYDDVINKNEQAALPKLNDILASQPTQEEALKLKAQLLLQRQEIEQALITYQQYVAAYPEDQVMSFVLARLLMDNQQSETAEPLIDKLLLINDKHTLLNQLKALARFNQNDTKNALLFAEKSLLNEPNNQATRLVAGVSAYKNQDFTKAHQHLSFIADDLPHNHIGLRLLAASQLALGLTLEANDTVNKLGSLTPQDNNLISSVGLALIQQGESEKVKSIINKVSDDNISTEALAKLGLLKLSLHDVSGITNLENALNNALTEPTNEKKEQAKQDIEMVLATAYLSTGQFNKALLLAEQLRQQQPDSIRGDMLAGATYVKLKDFEQARIAYNSALKKSPNAPEVELAIIKLLIVEQPENKALAYQKVQALTQAQPTYIPAITLNYLFAKEQGKQAEVIKSLIKTVDENNDLPALKVTLAKIYFNEKTYSQVIQLLEPLTNLPNKPDNFWRLLATSYGRIQADDKAIATYKKWLAEKPTSRSAIIDNILVLKAQNKLDEALALSDQLVAMQGENASITALRIELLLLKNDFVNAKSEFKTLPDNIHHLPAIKGLLGQLQFHQQHYSAALANINIAYQETPSSNNARLLYQCYEKLEQPKQATDFLVSHLQSNPEDLWALMQLAMEQIFVDKQQAITTYQKVLTINPEIAIAHNNLAFLLAEQGKLEQATLHGNTAIKHEPDNAEFLDTLGKILLDQNKTSEALKHLSRAVDITKEQTPEPIYLNYIEALIADQQTLLAKRKFEAFNFTKTNKATLAKLKAKLAL